MWASFGKLDLGQKSTLRSFQLSLMEAFLIYCLYLRSQAVLCPESWHIFKPKQQKKNFQIILCVVTLNFKKFCTHIIHRKKNLISGMSLYTSSLKSRRTYLFHWKPFKIRTSFKTFVSKKVLTWQLKPLASIRQTVNFLLMMMIMMIIKIVILENRDASK